MIAVASLLPPGQQGLGTSIAPYISGMATGKLPPGQDQIFTYEAVSAILSALDTLFAALSTSPAVTEFSSPSSFTGPNGALLVNGIVFTSHSPIATSVSWSAGIISYLGVDYSVAGGSTGATGRWIYWQLSNPAVLQTSPTPPTLGADDFVIGFNTSDGAGSTFGNFELALELHDALGDRLILTPGGVLQYNDAGNIVYSLLHGVDPPGAAILTIYNGTGAGGLGGGATILTDGGAGIVKSATAEFDPTLAAGAPFLNFKNSSAATATNGGGAAMNAPNKWLNVLIDGVAYKIPCFLP